MSEKAAAWVRQSAHDLDHAHATLAAERIRAHVVAEVALP